MRAAPDGTIVGRKLVKSSGNAAWDDAVLKAIDAREQRIARELAEAALLGSLADETPEGRSIVTLAREQLGAEQADAIMATAVNPEYVPFTAQTRMSGVDMAGRMIRKGAGDAIERFLQNYQIRELLCCTILNC